MRTEGNTCATKAAVFEKINSNWQKKGKNPYVGKVIQAGRGRQYEGLVLHKKINKGRWVNTIRGPLLM